MKRLTASPNIELLESRIAPAAVLNLAKTGVAGVGALPTVTIDSPTVTEGDAGITDMDFTVTLSDPATEDIAILYSTSDLVARGFSDFLPVKGVLNFAPGDTTKTITVQILGDTIYEVGVDENFSVTIENTDGHAVINAGDETAFGTITQDDTAPAATVTVDSRHPFIFFDANHDKVTVKLTSAGSAEVSLVGGVTDGADISEIYLDGTTAKSALSITVKKDKLNGDGSVTVGEIFARDPLKSITAPPADFEGGGGIIAPGGGLSAITIRDLNNGAIAIGGLGGPISKTAITLGTTAADTLIRTDGSLTSLTAKALSSKIEALTGTIAKITVKAGDFAGEATSRAFGPISVTAGNFSSTVESTASLVDLIKLPAIKSVTVTNGDLTGNLYAIGNIGAITVKAAKNKAGGNVSTSTIYGANIASFTVAHDVSDSSIYAGADLGSDHAITGGPLDNIFNRGSIGLVKIGGNATTTVIAAGLSTQNDTLKDADDAIEGGIASVVKKFSIGGNVDTDSYFAAGLFKTAPKIAGKKVVLPDPLFLSA